MVKEVGIRMLVLVILCIIYFLIGWDQFGNFFYTTLFYTSVLYMPIILMFLSEIIYRNAKKKLSLPKLGLIYLWVGTLIPLFMIIILFIE